MRRSWRRRWRAPADRGRPPLPRFSSATAMIRSQWTRRSVACAAASWPCSTACYRGARRLLNGLLRSRCWPQRSSERVKRRRCRRCSPAFLKRHERAGRGPRSSGVPKSRFSARRCPGRRLVVPATRTRRARHVPVDEVVTGGARAFPGALAGANPPAPPARAGGPLLTLAREPSADCARRRQR